MTPLFPLFKRISDTEQFVYVPIQSKDWHAACPVSLSTVYSLLVLTERDGTVVDSRVLYDITRTPCVCRRYAEELCARGVSPQNALREIELLL